MSVWWQKCTRCGCSDWIRCSDPRQAGRVAHQHVELAAGDADDDALMAGRVAWCRDYLDAGQHLRVAVEQLEPRVHEVEPVAQLRRLLLGAAQLGALDVV